MSVRKTVMLGTMLMGCGLVLAADDEIPDAAFLEYLGLWEESDEEWLLFDETITADTAKDEERSDPVPEGEESTETKDES